MAGTRKTCGGKAEPPPAADPPFDGHTSCDHGISLAIDCPGCRTTREPGIEAGRGEECNHRWEEVTVMAPVKSCSRCGLDEDEVKLHAAEEARTRAEQERDDAFKALKKAQPSLAMREAIYDAVDDEHRRETMLKLEDLLHANDWNEVYAEVERLQGELAGLREYARHKDNCDSRLSAIFNFRPDCICGLEALAPQEGAENGTKG